MRRYRSTVSAATLLLSIFFLLPGGQALSAQELTPTEQAIAEYVHAQAQGAEELLKDLVEINSGTMNHAGVREVGEMLAQELDQLGFESRWITLPTEVNRAGHLFAERAGTTGPSLLLIGHLDTVFEADDPFQGFRREGDWGIGPGSSDMKGGDVVMIYALKALQSVGALDNTSIIVAFTGDEESPGEPISISRKDLIEAAQRSDIALGFEGGSRDERGEYGTVARRSASEWILEVEGRQAHSSGIFSEEAGAGAIFEAARILNAFYEEVRGEEHLTFNAGSILGGTEVSYEPEETRGTVFGKTNVIPQRVVVHGGIRTISQEQLERTRAAMERVVAENLPRTRASIRFVDGYPPMAPSPANEALLEVLSQVNQDLGGEPLTPLDPGRRGAADISFAAPHVQANLAGLGSYGRGAHAPGEAVDLATFPDVITRTAIFLYRLLQESPATE